MAALTATPKTTATPGGDPTFVPMVTLADPSGNAMTSIPTDVVVKGAAVNRSGTITAGGTAQSWLVANANRRGFSIQNQSTGDLYIRVGQDAALNNTSLKIAPGDLYETPLHHISTNTVSIIGATTGQAWYGTEF